MTASAIRPAAVAGMFYPGDPGVLSRAVFGFLEEARRRPAPRGDAPKALIVPHAGYVYSGAIAASGYARLVPHAAQIRRVVLLGPCHRVAVRGLALPGCKAFATPLGQVRVDEEAVARIATLPEVTVSARAHALDHALEVQLPFLQRLLGDFGVVPLIVGQASAGAVADVLEALWGGRETLIVISSDLSHYLPYEAARKEDRASADAMLSLEPTLDHDHACGATPVNGLLEVARRRGMEIELVDLRNSGDTAGDRDRVVGYASLALYEQGEAKGGRDDTESVGRRLPAVARAAIAARLGVHAALPETPEARWRAQAATFVTLTLDGRLRGCIGSLEAHRPLLDDLRHNAMAAAFSDPRFEPLSREEFIRVRVEVSVLSEPRPLAFRDEADLVARLRPHVDGLILAHGARRATFLPQVWESLPDVRDFLGELKRKAGLPRDFWSAEMRAWTYGADKWIEA